MPSAYVPALRFRFLTRFYDSLMRVTLPEERIKRVLIEQASIRSGHRVLDLGCGTGTLTLMIKKACPGAEVVGLDGDREVLHRARAKARQASVELDFQEGLSTTPQFPPGTFDRVVSSLFFHHLSTEDKRRTLVNSFELLRPGGELHILDWGKPTGSISRVAFLSVRLLDGFEPTRANARGMLPELMRDASFANVEETHKQQTVFGTLALFRATKLSTLVDTLHST